MKKKVNSEKVNYDRFNSINDVLDYCMGQNSDLKAITDEYNNIEMTYAQLQGDISLIAGALQSLGISKGDKVSLFSENNGRWIVFDQAVLKCGGIDVIRGSNAPISELRYIISHSDSCALIVKDNKLFNELKPFLNEFNLKFVAIMFQDDEVKSEGLTCPVFSYQNLLEKGQQHRFEKINISRDDDATIIYTSGTTGNPKGVVLSHNNFIKQIEVSHEGFLSQPGEKTLQILPVWHAYERTAKYYNISRGCHLHYTTLSNLKNDLVKYDVDTLMSVPRIWEALRNGIYQKLRQNSPIGHEIFCFAVKISIAYKTHRMYGERRITNKLSYNALSTIRHRIIRSFLKPFHVLFTHTVYKKLKDVAGLNFRATISGGGALSMQDELFYDAMGVNLRIGYGLTETSPVVTLRGIQDKNYLGSAGKPVAETELKIVDPKTGETLPPFTKGLIMVRGPQVMKGYYKDEEATKAVLDKDGWFNTGDLGWLTFQNNLVLVGRLKETIVLKSGENVEPVPIEEACLTSPYIEQMVLVGQDQNGVGALIVPSKEALEKCGIRNMRDLKSFKSMAKSPLYELLKTEINSRIIDKPNLRVFEKIKRFTIIDENFSIENGLLSATAKLKRNQIFEKYKDLISKMYR